MITDNSPIFIRIKELLDSHGVAYQVLEHPPVYTSEEAARIRGTDLSQGAKALVFQADGAPMLLLVAGDRRIDARRFKKRFGIKDLRLAPAEEVECLTGLRIGSIPPFGNLLGLPTYVDETVTQHQRIVFNAGRHTHSIIMACQDFLDVVCPTVAAFSQ